jgi:hypothetical protein
MDIHTANLVHDTDSSYGSKGLVGMEGVWMVLPNGASSYSECSLYSPYIYLQLVAGTLVCNSCHDCELRWICGLLACTPLLSHKLHAVMY